MTESDEDKKPRSAGRTPAALGFALVTVGAIIALVALGPQRSNPDPDIQQVSPMVETASSTDSNTQLSEPPIDDLAEPLPLGTFPDRIEKAPPTVLAAYDFVADPDNHKLVQSLKCYCGCDAGLEHVSLFSCYIKELRPENKAIYSDHGLGCLTCLSEAWEAEKLKAAGKTPAEIKISIDKSFGPN